VGECFFWYRPTRVVPDKRLLNGCVCVVVCVVVCKCLRKTFSHAHPSRSNDRDGCARVNVFFSGSGSPGVVRDRRPLSGSVCVTDGDMFQITETHLIGLCMLMSLRIHLYGLHLDAKYGQTSDILYLLFHLL